MKALVWTGPRQLELQEVPEPSPGPGEVLLEVACVGICGSELSGYLGQNSLRVPPLVMGHEFVGRVVTGAKGRLSPGALVVVNPLMGCGRCTSCLAGRPNICKERRIVGIHAPGAFAERVAVREDRCHLVPLGLSPEAASLAEPLACSVRAVRLAEVSLGSRVLVLGAGPIGLLALRAARAAGARWIGVSDRVPERLDVARELGASEAFLPEEAERLAGEVDAAIDAVGAPATRRAAVAAVRSGGTAVFIGLHDPEVALDGNDIVRREITVRGSFAYTERDFADALALLEEGFVPVSASWSQVRPLAEGALAFEELIARPGRVVKIFLDPQA